MSRRHPHTPIAYQPTIGCQVWGHRTWEPDGYYCVRCSLPTDLWLSSHNGGIVQRIYHRFGWPIKCWWVHVRRPAQRWPFVRRCDDCQRVCEVWTWPVGDHTTCVDFPF